MIFVVGSPCHFGGDVVPVAVGLGGLVLVMAAPGGPVQDVPEVAAGCRKGRGAEHSEQFSGAGGDERDAGGRGGGAGAGDGQDRGGEEADQAPALRAPTPSPSATAPRSAAPEGRRPRVGLTTRRSSASLLMSRQD